MKKRIVLLDQFVIVAQALDLPMRQIQVKRRLMGGYGFCKLGAQEESFPQSRKERKEKGMFMCEASLFDMVRTRRIELPLPCGNRLLRPARLPVPPRPHGRIHENTKSRPQIQDWPDLFAIL
jgi:hypothetical protein